MFVGDICEENKPSIEDDSPNFIHISIFHSQLNHIYL